MFNAVSEAERDAITVIVFVGTFFIAVGIGRFLKQRAGVRLGLLFRLFCLILAFYAAIAVLRSPCVLAQSCWHGGDFVEHGGVCRAD